MFGEGKRSCTCEQPRLCAHFRANLASKFVFFNFLFTPAEYKFLIFGLDLKTYQTYSCKFKPVKGVEFQGSSGFSPTEWKLLGDFYRHSCAAGV